MNHNEFPYWPYEEPMPADCYVGVDLGQENDRTAITTITPVGTAKPRVYHVDHMERWLPVRYGEVVERVAEVIEDVTERKHIYNIETCSFEYKRNNVNVVVDRTGVGAAVCDQIADAQLDCNMAFVTITGGDTVNHEGNRYRVPKRDLVAIVDVLLRASRLGVVDNLPDSPILKAELANFRMRINKRGHDSYGAGKVGDTDWRHGEHDDLVLSTSLGVWYAETLGGIGRFEALPDSMRADLEALGLG